MKILFFTAFLFLSSTIFAQSEWVSIGRSTTNIQFLVKDFSKTNLSGVYSGWVKTIYPIKKIRNKKGVLITQNEKTSLSNWEINCTDKEYNIRQTINYNSKGEVIDSYDDLFGWSKIAPESMAESAFIEVCFDKYNN